MKITVHDLDVHVDAFAMVSKVFMVILTSSRQSKIESKKVSKTQKVILFWKMFINSELSAHITQKTSYCNAASDVYSAHSPLSFDWHAKYENGFYHQKISHGSQKSPEGNRQGWSKALEGSAQRCCPRHHKAFYSQVGEEGWSQAYVRLGL